MDVESSAIQILSEEFSKFVHSSRIPRLLPNMAPYKQWHKNEDEEAT